MHLNAENKCLTDCKNEQQGPSPCPKGEDRWGWFGGRDVEIGHAPVFARRVADLLATAVTPAPRQQPAASTCATAHRARGSASAAPCNAASFG